MTIGTKLFTWRHGKHIGSDELGNRYFVLKKMPKHGRATRWVVYAGAAEPSSVPPEWHGWLHYTTDKTPVEQPRPHHAWQKPGMPNMSGTSEAYLPAGHLLNPQPRQKNIADYDAWQPK